MNSINKHICVISPSLGIGGIERSLTNYSNYFASKGYKVSFVLCRKETEFLILDERIKVIRPEKVRKGGRINKLFYYFRLTRYLRKQITVLAPDTVLTMSDIYNPLVLFAARKKDVPVYVGDMTKPDRKFNFFVKYGKKIFYPESSGFIAQTNSAAEYYRREFGNRLNITVINGAVKPVVIHKVEKKKLVICVGRLSFEKGQDRLIEAFHKIKNRDGWKLIFTGSGPLRSKLNSLVEEYEMKNMVEFLGNIENIDLLYSEAGIFVLPSRMEGYPNALCEAMSAGLPCICFNSFPASEIINDGKNGFIIEDNDINALSEKIELLIHSPDIRKSIGDNAINIKERLSINTIGDQILNFILSNE